LEWIEVRKCGEARCSVKEAPGTEAGRWSQHLQIECRTLGNDSTMSAMRPKSLCCYRLVHEFGWIAPGHVAGSHQRRVSFRSHVSPIACHRPAVAESLQM